MTGITRSGFKRLAPWLAQSTATTIEGRKVYLRPPDMDDFEEWRDLRLASRKFLEIWEPTWEASELTRPAFRLRMRRYVNLANDDLAHAFFIFNKHDRKLAGAITLSNIRRGVAQAGTLGYWIGEPFARQGIMTDALSHLVPFAFQEWTLHRIEAACLPRNLASARLLDKCGFDHEGEAKAYLKINGVWEDHLLFGRVAG
jgi:[ribosomal protein S5]-alanine N-acetyltransferase